MEKSWKFSRPFCQDQDQDSGSQDPLYFTVCPRVASRPRPWSRGLHHWLSATSFIITTLTLHDFFVLQSPIL